MSVIIYHVLMFKNLSKEEMRAFAADIMAAELSKCTASTELSPSESSLSNCDAFFDNTAPSVTNDCLFKLLSYLINIVINYTAVP